jgi:HlyD family secretion protein
MTSTTRTLSTAMERARSFARLVIRFAERYVRVVLKFVKRSFKRANNLCGILAIGVAVLLVSCSKSNKPQTVSGTIETDEVRIASRYGGRVEKIHAREGDSLKVGQIIIELNAAELKARRDSAEATLNELVAGPRREEIATAKADWESQTAQLKFADVERKRAEELFAQKTISTAERDRAVSSAETLEKTAAAAKSRYNLLLAGTRPERIAQARAELATIDAQLAEMQLAAPSNSVLEVLSVKIGDVLAANQEAATLVLSDYIWVRVYVPETWLGFIKLGETVNVRVDSFPDKDFKGEVEQIARAAEFTPRNVQTTAERMKQVYGVKVRLDSKTDLRPGMAADVYFPNVPK